MQQDLICRQYKSPPMRKVDYFLELEAVKLLEILLGNVPLRTNKFKKIPQHNVLWDSLLMAHKTWR